MRFSSKANAPIGATTSDGGIVRIPDHCTETVTLREVGVFGDAVRGR